jgi:hypothetical protein
MQPLAVVNDFEELADTGSRVLEIAVFVPVNLVIFEGLPE